MDSSYDKWRDEYLPNEWEDDDKMLHIKEAVDSLNYIQKKIFLTYCELGSYAATAREFKVCASTAKKYIKHIKQLIFEKL